MPEWRTIATSASHPATVYVSYNGFVSGDTTCIGVAKSEDYGKTWVLSWKDRLTKGGNKASENFTDGWLNERFRLPGVRTRFQSEYHLLIQISAMPPILGERLNLMMEVKRGKGYIPARKLRGGHQED